ncbi:hypothetical protein OAA09_01065 [bacterium]|nr:hypothetical protein [bacterium]
MKVGDLVSLHGLHEQGTGMIVGFNKKGLGGKDFVHVLVKDTVIVMMSFDIRVIGKQNTTGSV